MAIFNINDVCSAEFFNKTLMVGRVVGMVSVFVGFFGDFSQIRRAVPKNFRQSSLDFFEGHLEYFCEINEVFWCIALRSDI